MQPCTLAAVPMTFSGYIRCIDNSAQNQYKNKIWFLVWKAIATICVQCTFKRISVLNWWYDTWIIWIPRLVMYYRLYLGSYMCSCTRIFFSECHYMPRLSPVPFYHEWLLIQSNRAFSPLNRTPIQKEVVQNKGPVYLKNLGDVS